MASFRTINILFILFSKLWSQHFIKLTKYCLTKKRGGGIHILFWHICMHDWHLTQENQSTWKENTCPIATLSTIILHRNAFGMKTDHHGEKLVNNCLTYSMFHYYHSQDLATSTLNAMGSSLTAISGNLIIQTDSPAANIQSIPSARGRGESKGGSSSNNTNTDTLSRRITNFVIAAQLIKYLHFSFYLHVLVPAVYTWKLWTSFQNSVLQRNAHINTLNMQPIFKFHARSIYFQSQCVPTR